VDYQVENVARAFYYAENDAQLWENEAEILKEEFRLYARMAISALEDKEQELDDISERHEIRVRRTSHHRSGARFQRSDQCR
jgi:hypothetical protein